MLTPHHQFVAVPRVTVPRPPAARVDKRSTRVHAAPGPVEGSSEPDIKKVTTPSAYDADAKGGGKGGYPARLEPDPVEPNKKAKPKVPK